MNICPQYAHIHKYVYIPKTVAWYFIRNQFKYYCFVLPASKYSTHLHGSQIYHLSIILFRCVIRHYLKVIKYKTISITRDNITQKKHHLLRNTSLDLFTLNDYEMSSLSYAKVKLFNNTRKRDVRTNYRSNNCSFMF